MYLKPSLRECFERGVVVYELDSDLLVSSLGKEEVELLEGGSFVFVLKRKDGFPGQASFHFLVYIHCPLLTMVVKFVLEVLERPCGSAVGV